MRQRGGEIRPQRYAAAEHVELDARSCGVVSPAKPNSARVAARERRRRRVPESAGICVLNAGASAEQTEREIEQVAPGTCCAARGRLTNCSDGDEVSGEDEAGHILEVSRSARTGQANHYRRALGSATFADWNEPLFRSRICFRSGTLPDSWPAVRRTTRRADGPWADARAASVQLRAVTVSRGAPDSHH